jgi:dipicolinate synthase subunit B
MSERVYSTDTRFGRAEDFIKRIEALCGREIIHTIEAAEPLGPKTPLDALIISPCTGNTLAKISHGITDSAVTMAAKAHLRTDRPLLIALATNDGLSQNLGSLSELITRRSVYFVPMRQDDPKGKPHSLVAEMSLLPHCYDLMLSGEQKRPIFLEPK